MYMSHWCTSRHFLWYIYCKCCNLGGRSRTSDLHHISGMCMQYDWLNIVILGALAELQKATASFVMSLPSVRSYGKTRLPLGGVPRNLIWVFFENLSRNWSSITWITYLNLWIVLRVRYLWDKSCGKEIKTHFLFNNLFPKILPLTR
jgi:hypothetical protein